MAQESRLIAFEQALKDEGIKGTNLEPVARSIFQQESSSGANVKTSNAGARGPMQVLPATFKAYNPQGNIDNPYDNSVGGLRYIKDLFNKTGDLGLTAVGYYGGPKAIEKAKQGIAVSDPRNPNAPNTLQYREQVMGRTQGTSAGKPTRSPVPKAIQQVAPELGPNYQAALALMAKADDLSDARERIAQEEEDNTPADFSQARQMLAQIKPVTGFAAQEPRRMASGGAVAADTSQNFQPYRASLSTVNFLRDLNGGARLNQREYELLNPNGDKDYVDTVNVYDDVTKTYSKQKPRDPFMYNTPTYSPSNPQPSDLSFPQRSPSPSYALETPFTPYPTFVPPPMRTTTRQPVLQRYNNTANYNFFTRFMADGGFVSIPNIQTPILSSKDKAKRTELETQLKKYDTDIKAYNAALEKYNTEIYNPYKTKTEEYNRAADAYNKAVEEARKAPEKIIATRVVYGPGWLRGGYIPYGASGPGERRDMPTGGIFRENSAYRVGGVGDIYIPGAPMPDPFTLTAPTAPDPFNMTAPTAPTTQEEIDKFITQAQAQAQRNAQGRQIARSAVQDPNRFNFGSVALGDLSGFGGTSTQLFAEGGEAKKESPSMGESVKGTAKEILRSMQYAPYDLLGAPVDVINLGLKGVDYVTGSKLATDKPVGGSDYLIQKSRELGIADQPTGSTTETLTRLGTGIVSPTAGPKALALAAEKVATKVAPKTASRAQLDAVKAAEPVPTKAAEPTAAPTPTPAFTTPVPDRAPGKMYPDEIDPAVQKQIEEIVVPSPAEKDRLFFGQVEKWTQSLSGKPTVQELKNRFSKVGRDYEINRLNLALEGKKPTDKVDAKELLETLKATSPQRYRTVINEPEEGRFFQGMDNPNPSSPLGTINLMEDVDPKTSLSGGVAQDLGRLRYMITEPYHFSARKPEDIKALTAYLKGPLINKPELAESVVKFEKDIAELDDVVNNLYKDKDAYRYIFSGSARVGLDGYQEIRKAQEKLLPKILQQNNLDPAKYEYNFQLPEAIRDTLDKQVQEVVSNKIGKELAKRYKVPFRDLPTLETTLQTMYDQARLQKKIALTDGSTIYEDALNAAIRKLEAEAPYSGHHMSITGAANPISFSRFMDIELPMFQVGNTKDLKGIFVTELQSDRLDDIRKFGAKGGSLYKDMDEYGKLDQQIEKITRDAGQFLKSRGNPSFKELSEADQKKYLEFGLQENKAVQKQQQIRQRLDAIREDDVNLYNVPEAFPGMADMPQVSQQLMIKNAVAAAIKRNNEFVLFPGADSAQPQLYEKLPFNVKTVVKDLGPGFEIKKVPMQSEDGSVVERLGIFWDEKAAKRIAKEGVRFAKGGSVDKNDLPNQKYI